MMATSNTFITALLGYLFKILPLQQHNQRQMAKIKYFVKLQHLLHRRQVIFGLIPMMTTAFIVGVAPLG